MSVSKHQESGPGLGKHYVPDTVFIACWVFLGNFMRINVHRSIVASTDQTPQEPHQGKFLNYSLASTAWTQPGKGWAGYSWYLFCLVASYKLEQGLTNLFHIISCWQLPNHYQHSLDFTQQFLRWKILQHHCTHCFRAQSSSCWSQLLFFHWAQLELGLIFL